MDADDRNTSSPGGSAQVNQTEGGYYGRIVIDQTDDKVVYCGDTNVTVSKDSGKTFAVSGLGQQPARPTSITAWSGWTRSTRTTS